MKKKFFTSIAVTFVMAAALVAVAPTSAQAAKAINVTVGATVKVKANKKVTWSVKDTSIATINKKSGKKVKLTGVKEGSTVLTTKDASGKTLDYAVNVKAAAAAPAATNKLQEFANYVKSKGGITYDPSVSKVWNNWEIKNNNAWPWKFAGTRVLDDNKEYQLVWRYGVKEGEHHQTAKYLISADANNVYFTLVRSFDEIDVRYINTTNNHSGDNKDVDYGKKYGLYNTAKPKQLMTNPMYFNEARYYIYGTIRNTDNFKVTIPLNGNACTATFAHNTDYDFFKGDGYTMLVDGKQVSTVGATYSEWNYTFDKAIYLTNAAYSWNLAKDGHDYLESPDTFSAALDQSKLTGEYANMSVILSYQLNNLFNMVDQILKDNATGYDLKSIGFNNYTNGNPHYYTNADVALRNLYGVAWTNIAFY